VIYARISLKFRFRHNKSMLTIKPDADSRMINDSVHNNYFGVKKRPILSLLAGGGWATPGN